MVTRDSYHDGPVAEAFGARLPDAGYFVVPRSVLQSMPREWQAQFVRMMADLPGLLPTYRVFLEALRPDPLADYRHPGPELDAAMSTAWPQRPSTRIKRKEEPQDDDPRA